MRAGTRTRVEVATRLLLQGRSGPSVTAELAENHGVSRRQARRVVAAAYQAITSDIVEAGIDRAQLVAQVTHCLQEGLAAALASGHVSAAVGCARELRELLGLSPQPARPNPRSYWGS